MSSRKILSVFLVLGLALSPARAQPLPGVSPAVDGIMEAFRTHRLVAMGEIHGVAQQLDFYQTVIRDPRFAREVGNVVVEFGGAASQPILDRFLNGENVPYAELRKVWTEQIGFFPTVTRLAHINFFAHARAVNQSLPPEQRIRVWLADPPIRWAEVKTAEQADAILARRDIHAAELIKREILAKGKKALAISGTSHFDNWPDFLRTRIEEDVAKLPPERAANMRPLGTTFMLVERDYPGAFFRIFPYAGYTERRCSEAFEQAHKGWPAPGLIALRGSALAREMLGREGCRFGPVLKVEDLRFLPAQMPAAQKAEALAREQAEVERAVSGVDADALLYLGPAAELTQAPSHPDLYLDLEFRAEIARQLELRGIKTIANLLQTNTASPRKFRNYAEK